MRPSPRARIALLLALTALAPPVLAQPQRRTAEARELYQKATRHYELGDYDLAIEEYKKAYEISAAPALLFNLGQVHRLKRDYGQALRFYTNYLRLQPQAANRADVEAFVVEMRAALEAQDKARRQASGENAAANGAPATVNGANANGANATGTNANSANANGAGANGAPASGVIATRAEANGGGDASSARAREKRWRVELWTAGAVAVVGLGATFAGVGVGVRANSDSASIARASAMNNQTWDATRQALYRDGQRSASAATALDIIGPVIVAGAAVVGVLAWRDHRRARRFALVPSGSGGAACAF